MKAGVSLYILSSPFSTSRGIHCITLTFSVTVLRYHNQKQLKKKVYSAYSFRGLESKRQGRRKKQKLTGDISTAHRKQAEPEGSVIRI